MYVILTLQKVFWTLLLTSAKFPLVTSVLRSNNSWNGIQYNTIHHASYVTSRKAWCRGWLTANRCIMKDEKRKKWCGRYCLTWLNGRYLTFMCQSVNANVCNIIGNNSNYIATGKSQDVHKLCFIFTKEFCKLYMEKQYFDKFRKKHWSFMFLSNVRNKRKYNICIWISVWQRKLFSKFIHMLEKYRLEHSLECLYYVYW